MDSSGHWTKKSAEGNKRRRIEETPSSSNTEGQTELEFSRKCQSTTILQAEASAASSLTEGALHQNPAEDVSHHMEVSHLHMWDHPEISIFFAYEILSYQREEGVCKNVEIS